MLRDKPNGLSNSAEGPAPHSKAVATKAILSFFAWRSALTQVQHKLRLCKVAGFAPWVPDPQRARKSGSVRRISMILKHTEERRADRKLA